MAPKWMSRGVVLISLSAFFADVGYQAVQALFPIYLVLTLSSSPFYLGLANAIAFGGGAIFAYFGGLLGNRHSRKWLAAGGSAFILLMPLVGLTINPILAIAFFAAGWWARNFRVPPRRSMLADLTRKGDLGKVFGFLHTLDIGGGMISVVLLLALLAFGVSQNSALMLTAIPLIISVSLLLSITDVRRRRTAPEPQRKLKISKNTFRGVIAATALYGFSYYSLGFPILTIAKSSNAIIGIGSYGVYLGVSAFAGYYIGSRKGLNRIKALGYFGYALSGIGTGIIALAYALGSGFSLYYLGVALMGVGLGAVETMEPTIISLVRGAVKLDTGMGILQASRGFGLFFANLIMGVLYVFSPIDSYIYASVISITAGLLVIHAGKGFNP